MKGAADLLHVRPILSSLLANKVVNEDEKQAILEYLGGIEYLDEAAITRASDMAENRSAVVEALSDILQKHDVKPPDEMPKQPANEPQSQAGAESVTRDRLAKLIGE